MARQGTDGYRVQSLTPICQAGSMRGGRRRGRSARRSRGAHVSVTPPAVRTRRRLERSRVQLYSMLKSQEAMRQLFDRLIDRAGNMPPLPGIYPDYPAPIIRNSRRRPRASDRPLGMPTPPQYLAGKKVDRGVTNIRQTSSSHWRGWLGPEHRCLVPFTSFAENETLPDGTRPTSGSPSMKDGPSPSSWASGRPGPRRER